MFLVWRFKSGKKDGDISYVLGVPLALADLGLQVPEMPELLDTFSHISPVGEVHPELLVHKSKAFENWWNCYCHYLLRQTRILNSEMHKICVLIMGDEKALKGIGKENCSLFSYLLEPCSFDGRLFQDGEDWHLGQCSKCICRDGVTQCLTASCQPLLCSQVRTHLLGDITHDCRPSLGKVHFSCRCTN